MEDIWRGTTFLLLFILILLTIYHIYYRMNIRRVTKELDEIMKIVDTNELITLAAKQKDMTELVKVINDLIKDIRLSRIKVKRMTVNFRQSITNIAHDLRTPLTTASGYLQMLQTDVTEEERQEYIKIILERQNMVKLLLEQLFEFVRIESGEITYEHRPVDARKVFIDTLAMYYDDFNKISVEPEVHIIEKSCMILGDEKGLKRIFSNILINAVIHGNGGYSFEVEECDKNYKFIFSNDSAPMTKDELDKIFERFYTKDKSRNKKTTGLGLAIAKEISIQLDGKIEASYNEGKFSISVMFPRYQNYLSENK